MAKSKLLNLQSCPPSTRGGPCIRRGRAEHSIPNLTKQLSRRPHLRWGQELLVQKLLPKLGKGSEHQSELVFHPVLCAHRHSLRSQSISEDSRVKGTALVLRIGGRGIYFLLFLDSPCDRSKTLHCPQRREEAPNSRGFLLPCPP